jgi:hypothetical protein
VEKSVDAVPRRRDPIVINGAILGVVQRPSRIREMQFESVDPVVSHDLGHFLDRPVIVG